MHLPAQNGLQPTIAIGTPGVVAEKPVAQEPSREGLGAARWPRDRLA